MTTASDEVWFVLLQGEQLGPLSFEDVLDFYYKDVVTGDSLLWREGWSDWVALIQIPEFNTLLFQGVMLKEPISFPSNNSPDEATAFISHQDFNQLHEQIITDDSQLEELESLDDLVDFEDLEDKSIPEFTPHLPHIEVSNSNSRAPVVAKKIAPKKSSPVKFILLILIIGAGIYAYILKPWEPKTQISAGSSPIVTPTSNNINSSLSSSSLQENKDTEKLATPQPQNPKAEIALAGAQAKLISPKTSLDTTQKLTDQGVESELALPTTLSDQGIQENLGLPTPQDQADSKSPGIEEIELDIDIPVKVESSNANNTNTEVGSKTKSTSKTKTSSTFKGRKVRPNKTKSKVRKKTSFVTKNKPKSKSVAQTKSKVRVTLGRVDLMNVLKKEKTKFKKCLTLDPKLKGTVNVMVIIQRNGKVSSAKSTSAKLRKSPANSCVITTVKSLRFPTYTGDLVSVPLPITL